MAFQFEPPRDDDSYTRFRDMMSTVDELHKHLSAADELRRHRSTETENKIIIARSTDEGGSERYSTIHHQLQLQLPTPRIERGHLVTMLSHHLGLVNDRLINLQELREEVNEELLGHYNVLEELLKKVKLPQFSSAISKGMKGDVEDIIWKISDLVCKLPQLSTGWKGLNVIVSDRENNGIPIVDLPGLHANVEDLTRLQAFRQVKQEFMELETERRICLLSFAVFPENREVHRTMLMYWWIGEGIIPVDGAEKTVTEVLKDFTDKKLVEPVEERRKVAPSSYKMTPFVHSSVIHLSKEIGLFDIYPVGMKPTMKKSQMGKVCLVEGSSQQQEAKCKRMPLLDIETVFNVSERKPEFTLNWFSAHSSDRKLFKLSKNFFKLLHVFYLGRWERTQKRHIHLGNLELMGCLKLMKNLKFLSFQGISTITRLKSSVCKLHKLTVLDLRECSDLTKLPEKIDSLHSLVYLDMTGCYMLEWIPMRLNLLNNLEVIKGFVVSDDIYKRVACTLSLLKRLKKLRKLSIEIHRDDLGVHQLMEDLVKLKALTSLRVTWRRDLNIVHAGKPEDFTEIDSLPHLLKKLDLQRFPHETLPTWLNPHNLLHLKKLHIGGGRTLKDLGELPEKATECAVEVLHLTCLPKLRVRWIELKQLYFPNLKFLEKFKCPRVSLTPCDGNGIWRSDLDD